MHNAAVAFDSYHDELNRRFGTAFPSRTHENNRSWGEFVKVGLMCSARGWDPEDYVRKAFSLDSSAQYLLPADLHRGTVVGRYERGRAGAMEADAPSEYRRCVELLVSRECDSGSDEKSLLLSPMTAFPAWFRCFYPESLDMDIVNSWGLVAKDELSRNPAMVALLSGLDRARWEKLRKVLWGYAPVSGETAAGGLR